MEKISPTKNRIAARDQVLEETRGFGSPRGHSVRTYCSIRFYSSGQYDPVFNILCWQV
ncbi:hypothetical protein WH47_08985 [Habropoda laboriosa]|uniref:Uncharacterized protein n=1 Tax=Habropoda laboriosa TaxID=597456 RepID=A0A0L7R6S5_9HYME|nr:hypothetical protein WH47_08985 [Habropoda laboriosa]